MGLDVSRARRALRSAGGRSASLYWPFGRERRARLLLRRRLAVLEAKNRVVDLVYRSQPRLADLRLDTVEDADRALSHPETRPLVVGCSLSREVIAEELRRLAGVELGEALDAALRELAAEGVVLRVPGKALLLRDDVYLPARRGRKPFYDVAELNRLVREGTGYGGFLRERNRKTASTTGGRSYDL